MCVHHFDTCYLSSISTFLSTKLLCVHLVIMIHTIQSIKRSTADTLALYSFGLKTFSIVSLFFFPLSMIHLNYNQLVGKLTSVPWTRQKRKREDNNCNVFSEYDLAQCSMLSSCSTCPLNVFLRIVTLLCLFGNMSNSCEKVCKINTRRYDDTYAILLMTIAMKIRLGSESHPRVDVINWSVHKPRWVHWLF